MGRYNRNVDRFFLPILDIKETSAIFQGLGKCLMSIYLYTRYRYQNLISRYTAFRRLAVVWLIPGAVLLMRIVARSSSSMETLWA